MSRIKNTDTLMPLGMMIGQVDLVSGDPSPISGGSELLPNLLIVGESLDYSVTLTNTGTLDLTNVVVTDAEGSQLTTIADFAAGETQTVAAQYQVKQADIDTGAVVISAKATDNQGDKVLASQNVPVLQLPSLTITETFDTTPYDIRNGGKIDHALQVVNYVVSIVNTGNETLTGLKTDDGQTLDHLDVGQTWTYSAKYQVTQSDMDQSDTKGQVKSVTVSNDQGNHASTTVTTPIVQDPEASIIMISADRTSVSHAGEVIKFTFIEANTGNVTINATAIDKLDGVWTTLSTDTLVPGQAKFLTYTYTVTQADIDKGVPISTLAEVKAPGVTFGDNSWKYTQVAIDRHATVSANTISTVLGNPQPSFVASGNSAPTSDPWAGVNAMVAQVRADMQDAAARIQAATDYVNSLPALPIIQPQTSSAPVGGMMTDFQSIQAQLQALAPH